MRVRVAMRHMVKLRTPPMVDVRPRYFRMHIKMDLPSNDRYLQKILSTAARASDTVPFIRSQEPVEIIVDMPLDHDRRKSVEMAVKSLPFVRSVVLSSGPPIR
jgi:hypothetical protein